MVEGKGSGAGNTNQMEQCVSIERIVFNRGEDRAAGSSMVKAAVKLGTHVYTGWRHYKIWQYLAETCGARCEEFDEGFVDSDGNFYDRQLADKMAWRSGQVKKCRGRLSSDKLWDDEGNPSKIKWSNV